MRNEHLVESCRAYLNSSVAGKSRGDGGEKTSGPVITISRASGARGRTIAAVLVERLAGIRSLTRHLPWTLFNQNLIQHVIEEHGLPERTAEFFREDRAPEEIRSIIGEILGLHPGVYNTQVKTAETIRRLGEAGNTVIVGRGGNFITADIGRSVHVRLVGSEAIRASHVARREGISHAKALEMIHQIDQARRRYIKRVFGKNIEDPVSYDLVLNTDHFTDEQAADLIIAALLQRTV